MKTFYFLILTAALLFPLTGQDSTAPKTLKYRSAVINGVNQITAFKTSVAQLNALKNEYLKVKFASKKDSNKLKELDGKIQKANEFMLKKYGMYPDVPYIATPEKATVSLLLTDEQLEKLSGEKPEKKSEDKDDKKRSRYPLFKLDNAKAVKTFVTDAKKGDLLRKKIETLKASRKGKGVEEQKKIAADISKLEDQLKKYDEAMKEAYKIHSNLDYILDTTALSVFLVISSDDLEQIGQRNKAKLEEEFKKGLKKK